MSSFNVGSSLSNAATTLRSVNPGCALRLAGTAALTYGGVCLAAAFPAALAFQTAAVGVGAISAYVQGSRNMVLLGRLWPSLRNTETRIPWSPHTELSGLANETSEKAKKVLAQFQNLPVIPSAIPLVEAPPVPPAPAAPIAAGAAGAPVVPVPAAPPPAAAGAPPAPVPVAPPAAAAAGAPAAPAPAAEPLTATQLTDRQLEPLIKSISSASTLYFIHTFCLRNDKTFLEIAQAIAQEEKIAKDTGQAPPDLWSIYRKTIGKDLGWLSIAFARLFYFVSYSIGFIPNFTKTFMDNVMRGCREKLSNPEAMKEVIVTLLDNADVFMEAYDPVTKQFKTPEQLGVSPSDQKKRERIASLRGDKLEALYTKFGHAIVDNFFPRVRLFEDLKQVFLLGYVFSALDFVVGGTLDTILRMILRYQVPKVVQSVCVNGLEQTQPDKIPFAIALIEALKSQCERIQAQIEPRSHSVPCHTLIDETKLGDSVDKFLHLLQRMPTALADPWVNPEYRVCRGLVKDGIVSATKVLFHHLITNRDAIENLFTTWLTNTNQLFKADDPGARPKTHTDLDNAVQRLELAASTLLTGIVRNEIDIKTIGILPQQGQTSLQEALDEQKRNAQPLADNLAALSTRTRDALGRIAAIEREAVADTDAAREAKRVRIAREERHISAHLQESGSQLNAFANYFLTTAHLNYRPSEVVDAFYQVFQPVYSRMKELSDQLHALQKLHVEYNQEALFSSVLGEMANRLDPVQNIRQATVTADLRAALPHLERAWNQARQAITPDFPHPIAIAESEDLDRQLAFFRVGIAKVDENTRQKEALNRLLEEINGVPLGLLPNLYRAVRGNPEDVEQGHVGAKARYAYEIQRILSTLPPAMQEKLIPLVESLQNYDRAAPPKPLDTIWAELMNGRGNDPGFLNTNRAITQEILDTKTALHNGATALRGTSLRYQNGHTREKGRKEVDRQRDTTQWQVKTAEVAGIVRAAAAPALGYLSQANDAPGVVGSLEGVGSALTWWGMNRVAMPQFRRALRLLRDQAVYKGAAYRAMDEISTALKPG